MNTMIHSLLKRVGVAAIVSGGLFMAGCWGTASNEGSGILAECYLNHADDNIPFIGSFNGKVAAGGISKLSLGACTDDGADIIEVRFSEGSDMTAEISGDTIQITANGPGESTLFVSRRGEDDVSFNLEAVTPTEARLDPQSFGMVVGSKFETPIRLYADDEFLAGGINLSESSLGGEGVRLEQVSPTRVLLEALETGEHSKEIGPSTINIKVVEMSEIKLDLTTVAGSNEESAMILCQFQDESNSVVASVPGLEMLTVSTNDESVCLATPIDARNGDALSWIGSCAIVERKGPGDCELTININGIESNTVVDFSAPTNEAP